MKTPLRTQMTNQISSQITTRTTTQRSKPLGISLQGTKRRIIQALSYEGILLLVFVPIVAWLFERPLLESAGLGLSLSAIALVWNIIFNYYFERWELARGWHNRGLKQRILHALSFEGGLFILCVPLVAYFLQLNLWHAIIADLGFSVVILLYTFVFQWTFDALFGQPQLAHD